MELLKIVWLMTQITDKQFKGLHVWLQAMADTLNDAGLDMKHVLKPEVDIPWTKLTVKEFIWKPILKVVQDEDSTLDMTTTDPDEILNIIARFMGEKHGVVIPPWPSNRG